MYMLFGSEIIETGPRADISKRPSGFRQLDRSFFQGTTIQFIRDWTDRFNPWSSSLDLTKADGPVAEKVDGRSLKKMNDPICEN